MRYTFAQLNKPVQLGKREDIFDSFETAVSQNELGINASTKTKQKGKFGVRNGKRHGGICEKINLVVPKKKDAVPPSLHNFFHCTCYKQWLISLMESCQKCGRADVTNEANFLAAKTWYTGTTLSGTGEDNYTFCKCLGEVDENGEINVSTSLWHIERVVDGKRLLLLPREAHNDDSVWVDFERLSLFAQRHAIRELVYDSLRKSNEDFHKFQRILEYDNLKLQKSTTKERVSFAEFREMLIGENPVVPSRNIKLCGKSGKSLAVEKMVVLKRDKNGKPTSTKKTYPNWEEEYKKFKNRGKTLKLETSAVERLAKLGSIPQTKNERDWKKTCNTLKACLPRLENRAQCSNFQDPSKPGICWECLLNTMDWHGTEECFESNRKSWKEWEAKFVSWKAERKFASWEAEEPKDVSEIAFRLSGSEPNRILYHSCRDHGKGHFHSIAIAIRLVDLETEKLRSKLDWDIESLFGDLRMRFSNINNGVSRQLQTYVPTPGISDVRLQGSKKFENEEASYFLLNLTNSLLFSITHFVYDIPENVFSVPLFCESLKYLVPVKRPVKRPCLKANDMFYAYDEILKYLTGKEVVAFKLVSESKTTWPNRKIVDRHQRLKSSGFLTAFTERVWTKPEAGRLFRHEMLIGDATYALCDVAYNFLRRSFFVAASNPLFTVLMPENFNFCMEGSPCVNVGKGDLISFDGKLIWWMHREDTFRVFDHAMRVARVSGDYDTPTFEKNVYQTPEKIYFTNGDVGKWCDKPYTADSNGVLMFADKGTDTLKVTMNVSKVPELIPFEIKLLFLSCDHRINADVFDESLKNPDLFEDDGEYFDLKGEIKKKFVKMGYDCHQAKQNTAKKVPNQHVQKFYLTCAVTHVAKTGKSVVVAKEHLRQYFPKDNSPYLEIFLDENRVMQSRDLTGNCRPLSFYPKCRVNMKADGKNWKRSFTERVSWKNRDGNFYQFLKYKPEIFDCMKESLSGSKEVFVSSKRFFPSAKTGWTPKGEFDFFSSFDMVPRILYGNQQYAFTDLLRPCFETPRFVFHGDRPVVLDYADDDAMDQCDDFEMEMESDSDSA